MNQTEYILEWLERFLKNRDVMLKKINEIAVYPNKLEVKEKDREVVYFASIEDILKEGVEENLGLVLYNTQRDFKQFLDSFDTLAKYPKLIVHFVNPFSKTQKRWTIFPHTHFKISEPESLELGLKTLFSSVDPTSQEEILKILK